ncbi:hypothetical protein [Methylobacter svalbardensis]|uniref:hypothetical protein n=1 Tax=Methylobacter svalbardensis TaxID=3080016 RepID=UPI0030EE98FE
MISGIIMILVVLWIYQSAMRAKTGNVMMWVAGAAIGFFVMVFLFQYININILESFRAGEGGAAYEALQGADRKNQGDFTGFTGLLKSVYQELSPSIFSFVIIAFLRLKFITKEAFTLGNLFGDIKEMFQGIKQSFKTSADK